jgi:two-component system sensor histidine kinase KdpD
VWRALLVTRNRPWRIVLAAVAFPAAATALALLPGRVSTTIAALVYVLAVMAATVIGGFVAGVLASGLSFLCLNLFFTPPLYTLRVERVEDVVALFVSLVASTVVATLLATAMDQRARAEQRERETRLLYEVGGGLLLGAPVEEVVRELARSLVALFDLARCEVRYEAPDEPVVVTETAERHRGIVHGQRVSVPIAAKERELGAITMIRPAGHPPLLPKEASVVRAFGAQIGLALEGARLAGDARRAQVDAETSTMRAALFSSVTHDLRTPLASITASVTNLLDQDATLTDADRKEHLETIREEAQRLNRLVGNLLDLARVRAGAVTPSTRLASVNEVVEGVVARLQPSLQRHRVRLLLRDDVPDLLFDVDQVDQVLTNVLENAAHHGPDGSEISVSTARWQSWVEVRISDQGPGIAPEDRERIFEPFVRLGSSGTGGTGLGLSIARALVEAHAGKIWIEGAPGGGTSVIFRLPIGA